MIKTQRKQHIEFGTSCFRYVLVTCLHEMNAKETTHSKPNLSQTNVITMVCTEMLSETFENNTFQPQSVRNQSHINYFELPGCLRSTFSTPLPKTQSLQSSLTFVLFGKRVVEKVSRKYSGKLKLLLCHWFLTLWAWTVLFFICSDNISVQNVVITLVSDTFDLECVVFLVF